MTEIYSNLWNLARNQLIFFFMCFLAEKILLQKAWDFCCFCLFSVCLLMQFDGQLARIEVRFGHDFVCVQICLKVTAEQR